MITDKWMQSSLPGTISDLLFLFHLFMEFILRYIEEYSVFILSPKVIYTVCFLIILFIIIQIFSQRIIRYNYITQSIKNNYNHYITHNKKSHFFLKDDILKSHIPFILNFSNIKSELGNNIKYLLSISKDYKNGELYKHDLEEKALDIANLLVENVHKLNALYHDISYMCDKLISKEDTLIHLQRQISYLPKRFKKKRIRETTSLSTAIQVEQDREQKVKVDLSDVMNQYSSLSISSAILISYYYKNSSLEDMKIYYLNKDMQFILSNFNIDASLIEYLCNSGLEYILFILVILDYMITDYNNMSYFINMINKVIN